MVVERRHSGSRSPLQTPPKRKFHGPRRGLKDVHLALPLLQIVAKHHSHFGEFRPDCSELQKQVDCARKIVELEQFIAILLQGAVKRRNAIGAIITGEVPIFQIVRPEYKAL